jgi:hypothetical protein
VALPQVPHKVTVNAGGADDTTAIQSAIDKVSKLDLVDGFRGAVLLGPGTFKCERPLVIAASGVVLRGSAPGAKGTAIEMTGKPHVCITFRGSGALSQTGKPSRITDDYVPSGALTVQIADASAFQVGDRICIKRPVTNAWSTSWTWTRWSATARSRRG